MKNLLFVLVLIMITSLQSEAQSKLSEDQVILTIENTNIPISDFLYLYSKNYDNEPEAYSIKSLREYYELFVKFKLKVFEAKKQGLHKEDKFIKEFKTYRNQLAAPYLTDSQYSDQIIKEAYERLQYEVSVSHILIRTEANSQLEDTLSAFKKINEIREKALSGEDFNELAVTYSEDPSAKKNKGELGYFSALQMVYPFENAAFNTSVGSISEPIRTRFGYHILKVNDKRPAKGEVKVAHILVRANSSNEDEAKKKIEEIYNRVISGENWEQLCKQFSEDTNSKAKGGELRAFTSGMMIAPFSEAAFALENPGDISSPVKTAYGWHIIKLLEKKLPGSFEEMKPEIEKKIKRDTRNNLPQKVFIERLKNELDFNLEKEVKQELFSVLDESLLKGQFKNPLEKALSEKILFTIQDTFKIEVGVFEEYMKENQRAQRNSNLLEYFEQLLESFTSKEIIAYEDSNLSSKYPEFKNVEQEYYEGLLLFEVMENEVWNKAVEDTIGLKNFFKENQEMYTWGKRLKALVFDADNEKTLKKAVNLYENGPFPASEFNVSIPLNLASLQWGDTVLQEIDKTLSQIIKDSSLFVKIETGYVKKEDKNLGKLRMQKLLTYLYAKNLDSSKVLKTIIKKQKPIDNVKKGGFMHFSFFTNAPEKLAVLVNQDNPLALQVTREEFEQESDTLPDNVLWEKGVYEYTKDGRYHKMYVKEVLKGAPKSLDETRGQVISDYQNYLEEKWIERLKQNYQVVEMRSMLDKIAKRKNK